MNETREAPSPPSGAQPRDDSADPPRDSGWDPGRLKTFTEFRRSRRDNKIAGVAGGLGEHLDVDPTILRVLFVVGAFFGGAGLLIYGALWLFVPYVDRDEAPISLTPTWRRAVLIAVVAIAAVLIIADAVSGISFPWFAVVALVVVAVYLSRRDRREQRRLATQVPQIDPATGQLRPTSTRADRGPILFWPALAFLAVCLGVLGTVDLAGADVNPVAYPAMGLTVAGLALTLGSLWGRAGGLILLGLVSAAAMVVVGIADPTYDRDREVDLTPTRAAGLADSYDVPAGSIRLDLADITDPEALAGRTVTVDMNAGEIVIEVPPELPVELVAHIDYGGEILSPVRQTDGWNLSQRASLGPAASSSEALTLDLHLDFGSIRITEATR